MSAQEDDGEDDGPVNFHLLVAPWHMDRVRMILELHGFHLWPMPAPNDLEEVFLVDRRQGMPEMKS